MSEAYGMEDLLGEFGERWQITYREFADGWQLEAVPRPPDALGPRVTAGTAGLLAARLRDREGRGHPAGESMSV